MTEFQFPGRPPARILQVGTPSLGDHSYVVLVGGLAVVIDPQRDTGRFEKEIAAAGAATAAVFETHIHNDYVSGGSVLAERLGARYVLPAHSGAAMRHVAMAEGDAYPMGAWRLEAVHTPGHTRHHLSYTLVDPSEKPVAVFTGGSMLVGAVGRSDLLGPEHTESLLREQYRSVHRLAAELADPVRVAPTHGAGSFCSASEVTETTSTIGDERHRNPALRALDVEQFADAQRRAYRLFPTYYRHMAPVNLRGADPLPEADPPELDVDALDAAMTNDTPVIDLRPAVDWASGHLPGTIDIPISDDVATYVGWVLPWNSPIVLLGARREDVDEACLQLARIGHDAIAGYAIGIEAAWRESGRPLSTVRVVGFDAVVRERPAAKLDVRDPGEVEESGELDGAVNIHVASVSAEIDRLPAGEVWVSCASGFRSAIAAGLLERAGRRPVLVVDDFSSYTGSQTAGA